MKIGIISDIHHGSPSALRDDWSIVDRLDDALSDLMARGADVLVDLGDRITDSTPDQDRGRLAALANCFRRFRGPRVHLLGNHDVETLSKAETEAILGVSTGNAVVDLGDLRLIAWQPDTRLSPELGFAPAGPQLDWLVEALLSDRRAAIICTHVPVSQLSMIGNRYFEAHQDLAAYPDSARVRAAAEETGRPVLWLSGHVHCNSVARINGITHLTMQSFSERIGMTPEPAMAYGLLDLGDTTFRLQVFGRDPLEVTLPYKVPPASIAL